MAWRSRSWISIEGGLLLPYLVALAPPSTNLHSRKGVVRKEAAPEA